MRVAALVMASIYVVLGTVSAIVFIPMGCPVWVPIVTLGPFVALFVALWRLDEM